MTDLTLAIAQLNFLVGDIRGNAELIIQTAQIARDQNQADVVVFPELALSGYPPEDLLLRPGLYQRVEEALAQICQQVPNIDLIVGCPLMRDGKRYNSAVHIHQGKMVATYHKQRLPNYSVFDEQRYFTAGESPCIIDLFGTPTAITICEDLWHPAPMQQAIASGAKLMISLNASPFDLHKPIVRENAMRSRATEGQIPLIYVNLIGGQDELVFDGGSMAISDTGELLHHAAFYDETLELVTLNTDEGVQITSRRRNPEVSVEERVYQALVLGVRDYVRKNNFSNAVIGLSGGIDSALTLAIAVDALGAEHVSAVLMPSRYTSEMSINDAKAQSSLLQVAHSIISIEPVFQKYLDILAEEFAQFEADTTEENLQARCRGMILMAISNKKNAIVLSTGNKSELSVGYSTLYGDMVGGFCVLKDVPKTWVYRLANYRNSVSPAIPQNVIDRAPSAELKANQTDQDSLPPYEILDQILERYIEQDQSLHTIIDAGFDQATVHQVVKMVVRNEYKRHQAPVGVRISQKAFGRDRRYPITSGYGKVY